MMTGSEGNSITEKVNLYFYNGQYQQALEQIEQSLSTTSVQEDDSIKLELLSLRALTHLRLSLYNEALTSIDEATDVFESNPAFQDYQNTKDQTTSKSLFASGTYYFAKGMVAHYTGNTELSVTAYNRALEFFSEIGDKEHLALVQVQLGGYWEHQKSEYDQALQYYQMAMNNARSSQKPDIISDVCMKIALILIEKKRLSKAFELLKERLEIEDNLGHTDNISDTIRIILGIFEKFIAGSENEDQLDTVISYSLRLHRRYGELLDLSNRLNLCEVIFECYTAKEDWKKAQQWGETCNKVWSRRVEDNAMVIGGYAKFLVEYAKVLLQRGIKDNAKDMAEKSIAFFKQDNISVSTSGNVGKAYSILHSIDSQYAFEKASSDIYGLPWLLSLRELETKFNDPMEIQDFWIYLKYVKEAVDRFWTEYEVRLQEGSLQGSEFHKDWRIRQLVEELDKNHTSEYTLNYLVGLNRIGSDHEFDYNNLRDEQIDTPPNWFVELPAFVVHGEKYLKIRLNNLVTIEDTLKSYPQLSETAHPPVSRIHLKLETQWLQSLEIDHSFAPNTDEERQAYESDPNRTWLKDIYIMDIENQTRKYDNIELTFTVELYFGDDTNPRAKSLTKRLIVPIHRAKNYDHIDKWMNNNSNFFTVILAFWSVAISIFGARAEINQIYSIFDISTTTSFLLLGGFGVLVILLVFFLFRKKKVSIR